MKYPEKREPDGNRERDFWKIGNRAGIGNVIFEKIGNRAGTGKIILKNHREVGNGRVPDIGSRRSLTRGTRAFGKLEAFAREFLKKRMNLNVSSRICPFLGIQLITPIGASRMIGVLYSSCTSASLKPI